VLSATGTSVDAFVRFIEDTGRTVQAVPLLGFAEAGAGGYFDDGGFPVGKGWEEVGLPSVNESTPTRGDLRRFDEARLCDGDIIIVSPAPGYARRPRSWS